MKSQVVKVKGPVKFTLNVEGKSNWEADKKRNFQSLGLSDRKKKHYQSLEVGDKIITYVKGRGFVDVRVVAQRGVTHLGIKSDYPLGAWPWQIKTEIVVSVGLEHGISPSLLAHTKLCAGDWRGRFQNSGRLLDPEDGETIANAILTAHRELNKAPAAD